MLCTAALDGTEATPVQLLSLSPLQQIWDFYVCLQFRLLKNHYFYETAKIDLYGESKLALLWYLLSESCGLRCYLYAPASESQNCICVKGFEMLFFCP